jgi:hypothetical protein
MNTAIEETGTAQAAEKPKASKKAAVGQKRAHVGPARGKAAKKPKTTKKAPKGAKKAGAARDGSKAASILVETSRWSHSGRADESDFVAGPVGAGILVRDGE